MSEQVLVAPAAVLDLYLERFSGGAYVVTQTTAADAHNLLSDLLEESSFVDRAAAEQDPSFKQLIPYCVLVNDGRVFAYRRTAKGGEGRLHGNWSVGVGGHINPVDGPDGQSAYDLAVRRELSEEAGLVLGDELGESAPVVGFIYDPSNEVGRVHLGVVHKVHVHDPHALRFDDPALAAGGWVGVGHPVPAPMENWSAIALSRLSQELFQ